MFQKAVWAAVASGEVMRITGGRGVDVAYDPVGGALGDLTRRLMAWEGRLLVVGFSSGEIPRIPANRLLLKRASAIGVYWDHDRHAAMLARVTFCKPDQAGMLLTSSTVGRPSPP